MRRTRNRNEQAERPPSRQWRRARPQQTSSLRPVLVASATVLLGIASVLWGGWGDEPYRTVAGPGHGRGMSQVGAFESARDGWGAERILAHYYPGAALGAIPPNAVRVRLVEQDDSSLDVYADAGLRVAGRELAPDQAAHLTPLPDGRANVVVTMGCDGDVLWQTATADPWAYPVDAGPNRPAAEHLTLCGGPAYRGALGVATEDGEARTINQVDVEDYVLGVVPAEVQADWADEGAAEALRAQAIAARSYTLAEQRYPYAQTCDTTDCQVYPGTAKEDPRATAAVAATTGTVLLRDGRILRSEYSAAPDGGEPADIYTFDVGPAPSDLSATAAPQDPRTQAPITESMIEAEYRRIGGANSAVGQPIGPEMILPQQAGTYRHYTNGVIIATPTLGARVVDFTTLLQMVPDPKGPQVPPGSAPPPAGSVPPPDVVPSVGAVPSPGVGPPVGSVPPAGVAPAGSVPPAGVGPTGSVPPVGSVPPTGAAPPSGSVTQGGAIPPDGVMSPSAARPTPSSSIGPDHHL
ncbi:SpoIID/LytB domain-containing protein [Nocardia sp. NBC_00881]|uniref:SpoIID/LytB domain-containing protein n=1 Tax=Nocardia sp. NBC_00881 TaxID=2975995 RepID=UPI0038686BBC|nr:SpoIID/LytB domain-containing protein [Nocardia sp. NBC_00881]